MDRLYKQIYVELFDKNIEENIILGFCDSHDLEIASKKEFINYLINNFSNNKINEYLYSLEIYNLKCLEKLDLYNKYKRLKNESLLLLCKHESIEYTSKHDIAYYFTSKYTEDQILDIIKMEKVKQTKIN